MVEDENRNLHYEIDMYKKNMTNMKGNQKDLSGEVLNLEKRLKKLRHEHSLKIKELESLTLKMTSLENQVA